MPTPGAERPIQRVPSGLPGPGGTGLRPAAQESYVGGYHHGLTCLTTIWKRPVGVGYTAWPVATGKIFQTLLSGWNSVSRLAERLIRITAPYVPAVTAGTVALVCAES